jgi:hypothetical protein
VIGLTSRPSGCACCAGALCPREATFRRELHREPTENLVLPYAGSYGGGKPLKIEADRALTRHAELAYYQSALVRCDYPGRSIRPLRNHAPIASAIPSGSVPSHCSTDNHQGVLRDGIHIHTLGGDALDKHADTSMNGGDGKLKCHAGACCGLLCCAAITGDSGATVVQPVHASLLFGELDERLDGRGPQRIGRPPKSFLSL